MQRLLLQDEDVYVETHTRALCATGCGFNTSSKVLCVIGTVPFSHVLLRKAVGEIRTAGRVVAPLVGHGDASLEDFVVVVAASSERDGQGAHDVFGRHPNQFEVFRICTARRR